MKEISFSGRKSAHLQHLEPKKKWQEVGDQVYWAVTALARQDITWARGDRNVPLMYPRFLHAGTV